MSAINILSTTNKSIDWTNLLSQFSKLSTDELEIFPIPKTLGFKEDGIGIAIKSGYINKEIMMLKLKTLIGFLEHDDFISTELYNGFKITSENIDLIIEKMLL